MKKLFAMVFALGVLSPICGMAGFGVGPSGQCAVDDDGGTDWFWYCGSQSVGCNRVSDDNKDHNIWLIDATKQTTVGTLVQGDPDDYTDWTAWAFFWESHYYACCGGDGAGAGQLKSYNGTWLTETVREVGGGWCTRYKNPCGTLFDANGEIVSEECDGPEVCPEGLVVGVIGDTPHCICPNGEGFNGNFSAECVSCAATPTQGVDSKGVCVQCSSTQFFKADNMINGQICSGSDCCIDKNKVPIIQHASLEWCYRCKQDKDLWLRCLSGHLGEKVGNMTAANPQDFSDCGVESETQIPPKLKTNLQF